MSEEPEITIDGATWSPSEGDVFAESFGDFDFHFGPDVFTSGGKENTQTDQSDTQGLIRNELGLPVRSYLGAIRPYFDIIDEPTQNVLRTRYNSAIKTIVKHHADAPIPEGFHGETAHLDVVYTVHEAIVAYSNAENYAGIYSTMIIFGCGVLEGIAQYYGFMQLEGFTRDQLDAMPLFRTMAVKMALEYGAGPMEGIPVILQVGGMIVLSMVTHVGVQMLYKKSRSKNTGVVKRNIMKMIMDQLGGQASGTGGAGGKATGKAKQKPKNGGGGGGMADLFSNFLGGGAGGLGSIFEQMMGGGTKKKKKNKRGKPKSTDDEESAEGRKEKRKKPKSDHDGPTIEEVDEEPEGGGMNEMLNKAVPLIKTFLGGKPKIKKQHIHKE